MAQVCASCVDAPTRHYVAVAASCTNAVSRLWLVAMATATDAREPWKDPVPTPNGESLASHRLTRLLPGSYSKAVPQQMEARFTRVIAGLDFALQQDPVHHPGESSCRTCGACGACWLGGMWAAARAGTYHTQPRRPHTVTPLPAPVCPFPTPQLPCGMSRSCGT